MPRKATLLKSLSRGRIRASFNKYNLFNLYKKGQVNFRSKTLYQQKWTAKQETRGYHGEYLTEGRWQTMFQPKLDSVAQLDASLRGGKIQETPFLLQTYAVLEKRLDFSVFRSMFSSSVRQARQFILHGNVYVNGVQIKHPGFTLKPGDMFNVKPEKVLQALGAKKPSLLEALKVDKTQINLWNKYVKEAKENPRAAWEKKIDKYTRMPDTNPEKQKFLEVVKKYQDELETKEIQELRECTPKYILAQLIEVQSKTNKEANGLTEKDFEAIFEKDASLSSSALKCFEEFSKSDNITLESTKGKTLEELTPLVDELLSPSEDMKKKMSDGAKISIRTGKKHLINIVKSYSESLREHYKVMKANTSAKTLPYDKNWVNELSEHENIDVKTLAEDESAAQKSIKLTDQEHVYGRKDPKKTYFTPWKPRPFLAPFAILPHHIEVSFLTCHAVYLRDPVARPGQSEVISPYNVSVHERAYMYYVRNGK